MNKHFSKDDVQIANKYTKRCLAPLSSGKCKSHLLEWLPSKRQEISAGQEVEGKKKPLCTAGRNVNWYNHYGKQYGGFSKTKNRATI